MDINKNLWEIIDHLRDELNITIDSLTNSSESCEELYKTNLKMNKEIEKLKHKPLKEIDALNGSLETYKRRLYRARDQRDELKNTLKTTSKHNKELQYLISDNAKLIKDNEELKADNKELGHALNKAKCGGINS